jgi:TetR/AcrR family transcriptional regulator, cholesterol catabolism regulator
MEELDNREKLLRGAEDLFKRYGLRSVSMDDIARNLGISKKTIYQHFADKDDVVASVSHATLERHRLQFDKIAAEAKNAVEEMVKISLCLKEVIQNVNPSWLFDMQKYHQRAWNDWLLYKHKFMRQNIVRSLKQGMEEGYFRSELKTEIIATMRLEQIQMVFDQAVFPRDQYDVADVQTEIFDHFVHGILTEKGKKLYQKYYKENCKELITR